MAIKKFLNVFRNFWFEVVFEDMFLKVRVCKTKTKYYLSLMTISQIKD